VARGKPRTSPRDPWLIASYISHLLHGSLSGVLTNYHRVGLITAALWSIHGRNTVPRSPLSRLTWLSRAAPATMAMGLAEGHALGGFGMQGAFRGKGTWSDDVDRAAELSGVVGDPARPGSHQVTALRNGR